MALVFGPHTDSDASTPSAQIFLATSALLTVVALLLCCWNWIILPARLRRSSGATPAHISQPIAADRSNNTVLMQSTTRIGPPLFRGSYVPVPCQALSSSAAECSSTGTTASVPNTSIGPAQDNTTSLFDMLSSCRLQLGAAHTAFTSGLDIDMFESTAGGAELPPAATDVVGSSGSSGRSISSWYADYYRDSRSQAVTSQCGYYAERQPSDHLLSVLRSHSGVAVASTVLSGAHGSYGVYHASPASLAIPSALSPTAAEHEHAL